MDVTFTRFKHIHRPDSPSRYYHFFVMEYDLVRPGQEYSETVNGLLSEMKEYLSAITHGGYNVYATASGIFVWIMDDKVASLFKLRYTGAT